MDYAGRRVTILGLGLFSGGVGAARFFALHGAEVTVTDLKPEDKLRHSVDALRGLPVRFVLGEHREADILNADLVVVNPAIKENNPYLTLARGHGIPITTEINLVFDRCRAPIIGVTGSNGKTTTTSLTGAIFQAHDARVLVGGNIGRSVLNDVDTVPADSAVVLELSSFQLKRLGWISKSPHIAVVTNLSPNHLDWHGTYGDYAASKQQIIAWQTPGDVAVLNGDDPTLAAWASRCRGRVFRFSLTQRVDRGAWVDGRTVVFRNEGRDEPVCAVEDIRIPGAHNLANALAAVTAARAYGIPASEIQRAVAGFQGVAHRLELVGELSGVRYYNDSAATTPESAIIALQAFDAPVVLIAGGYDKGAPFDAMAETAVRRAKAVVLIGATADKIERAIRSHRRGEQPALIRCATLAGAVDQSRTLARPGDVVVLSPGCASYDMFTHFEERGNAFRKLVEGRMRKEYAN